jgi:hypothetical protein
MWPRHSSCHANGKNLGKDVNLNCELCGQAWTAAPFMFMPIPSTVIPSDQKVNDEMDF